MAAENQVSGDTPVIQPTAGVGGLLRETRVSQGRDLATAATTLRIRQPYLLAIEEGRFQDLPGATYAVGFVSSYAEFLGLDSKEIVRRFKQENIEYARRSELLFPSAVSEGSIPTGGLLGFAILAAVVVYGVVYWYSARHAGVAESVPALPERLATLTQKPAGGSDVQLPAEPAKAPEAPVAPPAPPAPPPPVSADSGTPAAPEAKAPAALNIHEEVVPPSEEEPAAAQAPPPPVVAEAPPAVDAPKPPEAKPAKPVKAKDQSTQPQAAAPAPAPAADAAAPPSAKPAEALQPPPTKPEPPPATRLQLHAIESCWVEVRDSAGHVVMSRLMHKGESYSVPDRPGMMLTAGNAGALAVSVDGKSAGPLGHFGVVRHDIPLDPARLAGGAAAVEPVDPPPPAEPPPAGAKPPE